MNKLYLSYEDVHKQVNTILHDILVATSTDEWTPDYIVGITRGGLLPANLISQYLDVPMFSLDVRLRDTTGMGSESNCWMAEDAYEGKNILIVDDINDTGATINWIRDDWKASCLPNDIKWAEVWGENVRVATLVDNLSSKYQGVQYTGMEIDKAEDDAWIVFPWEDWWK